MRVFMQNEQIKIPELYDIMKISSSLWPNASPQAKRKMARMYYMWVLVRLLYKPI